MPKTQRHRKAPTDDKDNLPAKIEESVEQKPEARRLPNQSRLTPGLLSPKNVLSLQRTIGNRAIQRLLSERQRTERTDNAVVQRHLPEGSEAMHSAGDDLLRESRGMMGSAYVMISVDDPGRARPYLRFARHLIGTAQRQYRAAASVIQSPPTTEPSVVQRHAPEGTIGIYADADADLENSKAMIIMADALTGSDDPCSAEPILERASTTTQVAEGTYYVALVGASMYSTSSGEGHQGGTGNETEATAQ